MERPLAARLQALGAECGEVAGVPVVRRFADPAAEYRAVRNGAGLAERADLRLFRMWGRDPVKMLNGLITNELTGAPGQGRYAAMLTPKGRTIADLRVYPRQVGDALELFFVVANEAAPGVAEHLKKYVPPLFARWEEVSGSVGTLGIYGPSSPERIRSVLQIESPGPDEDRTTETLFAGSPLLVARTLDAGLEPGFDLYAPLERLPELWDALREDGDVRPVGFGALETLRIEAGRPRYGAELTEEIIPTEAFEETGLLARAISFTKGCYTGQEVIIRIAHRGHVNRHLRGLLLGEAAVPAARTPLFHPESGKQVGWTTSAAISPLLEQTIALGYVRRELAPGAAVHLGMPDGRRATVAQLPFRAGPKKTAATA
jgi:folate-binding protein YgfZ